MSKEKLLLVEDDVNFGFVLKSYLEMNDFYVTLITDGKDAVNAFLSREYNLCILDVMLPNVDGFTIAKEIKRISPSCPVIFLTARSLKEDIMEGFRIGADDYLTKPFKIRSLTSADEEYRLTPREADLLKALYINKNNVLDRNEALKKIWGDDNYFNARSMDVYITKLRKYFKNDESVQIDNIHGSGFILVVKE